MFYYFGRKGRLAPLYPFPLESVIVEPFAGSMAYSLYHKPMKAYGYDIDANVAKVWNQITSLSPDEILAYPEPEIGERVTDRWQMMAAGSHGTSRALDHLWTDRMARDLKKQKRMAAANVEYAARRVIYREGDYHEAPDVETTWFIDPPYQRVQRGYERGAIDYAELADWCRSRRGQVIVCEQEGADWLPFRPLISIRGTTNKPTVEMIWTQGVA